MKATSNNKLKLINIARIAVQRKTLGGSGAATILSDMDLEIEALEKKLSKSKMLKQGMMQALLTGRTRLL